MVFGTYLLPHFRANRANHVLTYSWVRRRPDPVGPTVSREYGVATSYWHSNKGHLQRTHTHRLFSHRAALQDTGCAQCASLGPRCQAEYPAPNTVPHDACCAKRRGAARRCSENGAKKRQAGGHLSSLAPYQNTQTSACTSTNNFCRFHRFRFTL